MSTSSSDAPEAVTLRCLLERRSLKPGERVEVHAVLELRATAAPARGARPRLSVVFALDVSGSMQGPPLEHVVGSMDRLIDLLAPEDRVGVVAFSHNATVVDRVEARDPEGKRALKQRLRRLEALGSTNIEAGLTAARALLPARAEHERQAILLLSDGAPNVGANTVGALSALASDMRPDVSVSALGYGPHHVEDILYGVAEGGGGQYVFISDPLECERELALTLGAQAEVVADGVDLLLVPAEGVEVLEVLGAGKSRFTRDGILVPLPDLLEGAERPLVVKLTVETPREGGALPLLAARLRYRVGGSAQRRDVETPLVVDVLHGEAEPLPEARARVILAYADRARAEARALGDRGQFDGAARVLRDILSDIEQVPGYRAGDSSALSEAYEQILDEAMAYERKPSLEEYRDFRRTTLGMDMLTGAAHLQDRASTSAKSQELMQQMAGELPPARLVLTMKDGSEQVFPLGREACIGRTQANDICLPLGSLSKRHTRVVGRAGRYIVVDLKSTNGTYLNGKRIQTPQLLNDGDVLYIGDAKLRFETDGKPPALPAAPALPAPLPRSGARLVAVSGPLQGNTLPLPDHDGEVTLGRHPNAHIVLADPGVARRHARIVAHEGRYILVDLKSTNGTALDGKRVSSPYVLRPGQRIEIGQSTFVFEGPAATAPTS